MPPLPCRAGWNTMDGSGGEGNTPRTRGARPAEPRKREPGGAWRWTPALQGSCRLTPTRKTVTAVRASGRRGKERLRWLTG